MKGKETGDVSHQKSLIKLAGRLRKTIKTSGI